MARCLTFRIKEVEGLYSICSENKGAGQRSTPMLSQLQKKDAALLRIETLRVLYAINLSDHEMRVPCNYKCR